jgi:hypothetical protein
MKLFRDPQVYKKWFKARMLRSWTKSVTVQHVKPPKKKIRASVQYSWEYDSDCRELVHVNQPVDKLS